MRRVGVEVWLALFVCLSIVHWALLGLVGGGDCVTADCVLEGGNVRHVGVCGGRTPDWGGSLWNASHIPKPWSHIFRLIGLVMYRSELKLSVGVW